MPHKEWGSRSLFLLLDATVCHNNPMRMKNKKSVDRIVLLKLAALADCDPRSIAHEFAAMEGERAHVRGRAGEKIRRVLEENGFLEKVAS